MSIHTICSENTSMNGILYRRSAERDHVSHAYRKMNTTWESYLRTDHVGDDAVCGILAKYGISRLDHPL